MQAKMAMMEVGRVLQKAGPYVVLEVVLPGGTLFALLLYLYRTGQLRKYLADRTSVSAGSEPHLRRAGVRASARRKPELRTAPGRRAADARCKSIAAAQKKKRPRAAAASSLIQDQGSSPSPYVESLNSLERPLIVNPA